MRKEKVALHLARNATSAIRGIISPPCASLGIIVATSPENKRQAEGKKEGLRRQLNMLNLQTRMTNMLNLNARMTNMLNEEFFSQAAEQLAQAKKIREIGKDGGNYRTVAVRLNDVDVVMEADSGADVNIMDEHQFKAFIHRTNEPTLTKSSVKLHTLQHKLDVKGEFQTVICNRTCGKATKFDVVSERIHSPPLFSKETLTELRMLKIHPDSCFAEPNDLAVSKEGHSKHC